MQSLAIAWLRSLFKAVDNAVHFSFSSSLLIHVLVSTSLFPRMNKETLIYISTWGAVQISWEKTTKNKRKESEKRRRKNLVQRNDQRGGQSKSMMSGHNVCFVSRLGRWQGEGFECFIKGCVRHRFLHQIGKVWDPHWKNSTSNDEAAVSDITEEDINQNSSRKETRTYILPR